MFILLLTECNFTRKGFKVIQKTKEIAAKAFQRRHAVNDDTYSIILLPDKFLNLIF